MLVKEIMTTVVKTIRPEDSVKTLAERMVESKIGSMVVVSGSGEVVGIATERDIIEDVVLCNVLSRSSSSSSVNAYLTSLLSELSPNS